MGARCGSIFTRKELYPPFCSHLRSSKTTSLKSSLGSGKPLFVHYLHMGFAWKCSCLAAGDASTNLH